MRAALLTVAALVLLVAAVVVGRTPETDERPCVVWVLDDADGPRSRTAAPDVRVAPDGARIRGAWYGGPGAEVSWSVEPPLFERIGLTGVVCRLATPSVWVRTADVRTVVGRSWTAHVWDPSWGWPTPDGPEVDGDLRPVGVWTVSGDGTAPETWRLEDDGGATVGDAPARWLLADGVLYLLPQEDEPNDFVAGVLADDAQSFSGVIRRGDRTSPAQARRR